MHKVAAKCTMLQKCSEMQLLRSCDHFYHLWYLKFKDPCSELANPTWVPIDVGKGVRWFRKQPMGTSVCGTATALTEIRFREGDEEGMD